MPMNVEYVLRETGTNLKRNFTLTIASMLTVSVSLALFGGSLLIRQGVSNATLRWKGNVQFIVFLNPDVQTGQRLAVRRALDADPDVKKITYFDQQAAYKEFRQLNKDQPAYLNSGIKPSELPSSYRVAPVRSDFQTVSNLVRRYKAKAGVFDVYSATETIKTVQRLSGVLSTGILFVALVLLGAAIMLILNTIRTAMFARRREIEVMKLVGATNWFIRVPFMLEGLVEGLFGAGLAILAVVGLNGLFADQLAGKNGIELLQQFVVDSSDVVTASVVILVVGLAAGAIGAAVAVSRFLDV